MEMGMNMMQSGSESWNGNKLNGNETEHSLRAMERSGMPFYLIAIILTLRPVLLAMILQTAS